jgi:nitronate monooxygenase
MQPAEIRAWCSEFRASGSSDYSREAFQINLWIPGPSPARDPERERRQREFLAQWGPAVPAEAADANLPDFDAQCQTMLEMAPKAISSIMGLYPPAFVSELKARRILWFANVTTVAEAKAAAAAGADVVVAQGMEAGGHRGGFDPDRAEHQLVGLMSLLPQVKDAVRIPVVATGGIADARGIAAALTLGASAVQIGTAFLRTPEAKLHPAYAARLAETQAEQTVLTRAFSGRLGRSVATAYVRAAAAPDAPPPAAYPVQRALTRAMREAAQQSGDAERMQLWAGQSARLGATLRASAMVQQLWDGASQLLR